MAGNNEKELTVEGIKNQNTDRENEEITNLDSLTEKLSPEEEYLQAAQKHNKKIIWVGALTLALQIGIVILFGSQILVNDFHNRLVSELLMLTTGQLNLSTGIYAGDTEFGYFDGNGKFTFISGATYIGEWNDNQIEGMGVLKVPIEGEYKGEFSDSQKNGEGTFTWDDGTVYTGEWKNDRMCGQGEYTTSEGQVYSGTFSDNTLYAGKCAFDNNTGKYVINYNFGKIDTAEIEFADGTKYIGKCTADEIVGTGSMTFPSEDLYTGDFENGFRNGQGIYYWKSTAKYDGEWINDKMSGTGTYTFSNGNTATGTFDENQFVSGTYHANNSFGEYSFIIENGEAIKAEIILVNGTTYSGAMSEGKLNGQAQIKYSNGDTYSGDVANGRKSGKGIYTWFTGASYDGDWSNDQMHGSGTYLYSSTESGYRLTGNFENGKPNGVCQYYVSTTKGYKTDWVNGECIKVYE